MMQALGHELATGHTASQSACDRLLLTHRGLVDRPTVQTRGRTLSTVVAVTS